MLTRIIPIVSASIALGISACTFSDGEAWGVLDAELTIVFDPARSDPARVSPAGELVTDRGDRVQCEALQFYFSPALLRWYAEDTDEEDGEDCHGGHCHRQLSSEDSDADVEFDVEAWPVLPGLSSLWIGAPSLALRPACNDQCELRKGHLADVVVGIHRVDLRCEVRSGSPENPVVYPLQEQIPIDVSWALGGDYVIDEASAKEFGLRAQFELPPGILDGVEFDALLPGADVPAVREELRQQLRLSFETVLSAQAWNVQWHPVARREL